ncbi:MAG: radical SAM family heme chaperone HemW [Deltaproteobacteria bacterium]|nr:radical SAM family heme chaperone HemW [Deltaproteobacteria bacterium]
MTPAPGLYVHVPFCQSKCPYCDFYSITSPDLISAYLEALENEASLYKDSFASFDSLYLGGGTPSLLTREQLTSLTKNLRRHLIFSSDTEFTLEANPDDLTTEKLRLWRDLGINRLSLGVQSFDEAELVFLQRRHTARQTMRVIELIRAAGFANLGLDLMYGLPGQSIDAWLKTLETALSFTPEHLSCYQLTIEAGETPAPPTPLARRLARGEFVLPDEEAQREFFLLTRQFLEDRGYIHYEISNFARGEEFLSRHNRKYWNHTPYLGLGPAAHSYKSGRRWWNFASVAQYCAALNLGTAPVAGSEDLTPEQLRLEALYLGFRTRDGVPLEVIQRHPRWPVVLSELGQSGLVKLANGRVTATAQGLVVADRLPLLLVD